VDRCVPDFLHMHIPPRLGRGAEWGGGGGGGGDQHQELNI
jgi:hypothetical protein